MSKVRVSPLPARPINPSWQQLLAYTEEKLRRSRLKVTQLEHLLKVLRRRCEDGEPCPTEIPEFGDE